MTRPLRIEYSGAYYHLVNGSLGGLPLFKDNLDRESFIRLIDEAFRRWDLQVYAFCLLENSYHLCVQTPAGLLSRIMRHINGVYTQKYNRRYRREGPLFKGRYRAVLIERDPYVLSVIRHIHLAPRDLGQLQKPERYLWSSFKYYDLPVRIPEWLDPELAFLLFRGKRRECLLYLSGREKSEPGFGDVLNGSRGPVLGSESFKEKIRKRRSFLAIQREIPESRLFAIRIRECISAVATQYDVAEETIKKGLRGRKNEARQVAMFICREAGGYRHREIAQAINARSYSTVSSACAQLKKKMEHEEHLRHRVFSIYHRLKGDR